MINCQEIELPGSGGVCTLMAARVALVNLDLIEEEIEIYDLHIEFLAKSLNENPTQAKRDYLKELKEEKAALQLFLKLHSKFTINI